MTVYRECERELTEESYESEVGEWTLAIVVPSRVFFLARRLVGDEARPSVIVDAWRDKDWFGVLEPDPELTGAYEEFRELSRKS